MFGWFGARIVSRRPNHVTGWLLCAVGLTGGFSALASESAIYGWSATPAPPVSLAGRCSRAQTVSMVRLDGASPLGRDLNAQDGAAARPGPDLEPALEVGGSASH